MEYELGAKFIHCIGGEDQGKAVVVAIRKDKEADWSIDEGHKEDKDLLSFLERTKQDVVLFGEMDFDEDYITSKDLTSPPYYGEGYDWTVLVSESKYAKSQEVSKKIIEILKGHDIDTRDLIISDGKVYQGYSECAQYIQTTHAWCSSSMSC